MLLRVFFVALLAVGALAIFEFTDDDVNRFKQAFRRTCKENGVEDKAEDAANAFGTFIDCARGVGNAKTIRKEIDDARPSKEYTNVFEKYCARAPELASCSKALFNGLYPCLPEQFRGHLEDDKAKTETFFKQLCDNNGQKLIGFFNEGGFDCLRGKDDDIRKCVDERRKGIDADEEMKHMDVSAFCARLIPSALCAKDYLKECTPASIGEFGTFIYEYLSQHTPCKNI